MTIEASFKKSLSDLTIDIIISKNIFDEISEFLDSLDNDDDVQNIFTNLKIGSN